MKVKVRKERMIYKAPVLFYILLLLTNCCGEELKPLRFSKDDLKINPYKDKDTLVFAGSDNDTIVLWCIRELNENTVHSGKLMKFGKNMMCENNYKKWYKSEIDINYFYEIGEKKKTFMSIYLDFACQLYVESDIKHFIIDINFNDDSVKGFDGVFCFNDKELSVNKDAIRTLSGNSIKKWRTGPYDTGLFYELSFEYELNSDKESSKKEYTDYVHKVYYSITNGVIGFRLRSGKNYILVRSTI